MQRNVSVSPKDFLNILDNKVMRTDMTVLSMDRKKPIHKFPTQNHYKLIYVDPESNSAHYKVVEYKNAVDSNRSANVGNYIVAKLKQAVFNHDPVTNSYILTTASATGGNVSVERLIDPTKLVLTGTSARSNPGGNTVSSLSTPDANPPPISFEEGENLAYKSPNPQCYLC